MSKNKIYKFFAFKGNIESDELHKTQLHCNGVFMLQVLKLNNINIHREKETGNMTESGIAYSQGEYSLKIDLQI